MSDKSSQYDNSLHDNEDEIYSPPSVSGAQLDSLNEYHRLHARSIENPNQFWNSITKDLYFEQRTQNGLEYNCNADNGKIFTHFMDGSISNISYNCLERIIDQGKGKKIAYKFEGNEPSDSYEISYEDLHAQVVNFSAVLRSKGVKKSDVVAICLPMILELPIAMLACTRIGAVHAVIFAGFSAEAVCERLIQANAQVVVTADAFARGPKIVCLKNIVDAALEIAYEREHQVKTVLVVEHSRRSQLPSDQKMPHIKWNTEIDCKWNEEMQKCSNVGSPVEWVEAEHPAFLLYTSGSTGKPKGIVHSTIGYMTYAYCTTKYNFCCEDNDIYWCTADCGWITGHSYIVYGPLLNGMTSILFEGIPTYPTAHRIWSSVEKYQVTVLYTSPTAVRSLMSYPDHLVTDYSRKSLKLIGTVGEPLNAAAWKWLYNIVGEGRCSVIDTYWQTETGGHMMSAQPGVTPMKPGSTSLPFFGVQPILLDNNGKVVEGPGEGNLCFNGAWPGISRTIFGDHERFEKTYYKPFPGYYFTGDSARRDADGYYWITGRIDDMMNVSGHLLSTVEIESALALHDDVVESAVVAAEHPIKGHAPYAYVVMRKGKKMTEAIVNDLKLLVRHKIGAIAVPEKFQHAVCGLPKTRSGKITRRILRKIADGDQTADLGDTSTLINASVIDQLWSARSLIRAG